MADLERPERLQIMLSADELVALENWRFDKRMPSRAAAVRELLRRGLAADGFMTAATAPSPRISASWPGTATGWPATSDRRPALRRKRFG